MKYLKLYENFLFELKKNESGKISILTDINQLPKIGVPTNKSEYDRDGIAAIDWENIVCVRSSNELPTISGKNLVCHTGRALKTVGFNKSFEDYLKKEFRKKDEPDGEYLRRDPNYKDFETFKKYMLEVHGNRWTKHFTLNHFVSSHSSGSWTGNKYVYLTPGKEMIKVNGKPASLYAIDTYWNRSIVLTDNTVILYHNSAKSEVEDFVSSIEETRNVIYFLEVGTKKDEYYGEELDIEPVIGALGYTVFGGGTHYSVEDNLDMEIRDLKDKEGIKSSGIHWGQKYDGFEHSQSIGFKDIFEYLPGISHDDYYNFSDKVIKREEKEYEIHRGFIKEALLGFKRDTFAEDTNRILETTTKIARAICTPKYAYYEHDHGNGLGYDDPFEKKIDLLNWNIKNLEPQLKSKEEEEMKIQYVGVMSQEGQEQRKKDGVDIHCRYVYFNKYLLNDLKIMLRSTQFYKGLEENKSELLRLCDSVKNDLTDDEVENIIKLDNFGKFISGLKGDEIDELLDGPIVARKKLILLIVNYFNNLNSGAKKYGFKDLFDMFSVKS